MYAIYFCGSDGSRLFITAVDDKHSAMSMAKLLSRQDPRDIVVIENRPVGDTELQGVFRRGALHNDDDAVTPMTPSSSDADRPHR